METVNRKQTKKISSSGSFMNMMMGNNSTLPVVGEGATKLLYSDRLPYQVVEVSEDFKRVKLEEYSAHADKSTDTQMGHQNWKLCGTGQFITVVWKWGAWREESEVIRFKNTYRDLYPDVHMLSTTLTDVQRQEIYQGEPYPQRVVEGITEKKKEYNKISILFGRMEYYYDWTF